MVVTNAGNNLAQVTPATIDLPIAGVVDDFYEAREGMLVTFVDTLTVSEYFELARFGQIVLYEGGRPRQFTEANAAERRRQRRPRSTTCRAAGSSSTTTTTRRSRT